MKRNRHLMIALAALLACAVLGLAAVAAGKTKPSRQHGPPSGLDTSFGRRGLATLGPGYQIFGVATQPDNKVVVVGDKKSRSSIRLMVARLTSGGRLDRSFNHGHVEFGPAQRTGGSIGRAVAVQRDGKVVVAGTLTDRTGEAQEGLLVQRFSRNGGLDRRFGSRGTATALTGTAQSAAAALAIQRNGEIVVAGNGPGRDGLQRIAVARFGSSGRLDRRFGSKGVLIADGSQELGRDGTAGAVAIQSSGKIVIAGSVRPGLQISNAIVARLSSGGRLDRSFGSAGSFTVPGTLKGGGAAVFRAVTVSGGAIVAAGAATSDSSPSGFAIAARLSAGGHPVGSFGQHGIVALASDSGSLAPTTLPGANAAVAVKGGRTVLAGSYLNSGLSEVALWSLNSHGSLIGSGSSKAKLPPSLGSGTANALAVDGFGRLVVAGVADNFFAFNGFVLRYHGFGR